MTEQNQANQSQPTSNHESATNPSPPSTTTEPVQNGGKAAGKASQSTTWQAPAGPPLPTFKRGPRLGLVIWGLLLTGLGLWLVVGSTGYVVDSQLVLIGLAAGTGLVLVIAAIASAISRSVNRPLYYPGPGPAGQ